MNYCSYDTTGNGNITSTWDCVNNNCVDPGTGNGTYSTLANCQAACGTLSASWNCVNNNCIDAGSCNGTYSTLADCQAACGSISSITTLNLPDNDIAHVYPNPSSSEINIQIKSDFKRRYTIELFNEMGKSVRKLIMQGDKTTTLEKMNLPSGLYFLQFTSADYRWTEKVIFQ